MQIDLYAQIFTDGDSSHFRGLEIFTLYFKMCCRQSPPSHTKLCLWNGAFQSVNIWAAFEVSSAVENFKFHIVRRKIADVC